MNGRKILNSFIIICLFKLCYGDWMSEWMEPIREKFSSKDIRLKKYYKAEEKELDTEKFKTTEGADMLEGQMNTPLLPPTINITPSVHLPNLKALLESVLRKANELADSLKTQISIVEKKERDLKEAIVNGRFGITTVSVSTVRRLPRRYIIREGFWTLCNGVIQLPTLPQGATMESYDFYGVPRCIGQEVASKPDRCVFNSVIKYETIPTRRESEYAEEEYLCLKSSFNSTLEQYSSVPKRLVDQTCKNGIVRTIDDNVLECGLRVISDYTYYPNRNTDTSSLPLEYCESNFGTCKLIVAWHLSNSSIENFEYIKDDLNFKNYFMKAGSLMSTALY